MRGMRCSTLILLLAVLPCLLGCGGSAPPAPLEPIVNHSVRVLPGDEDGATTSVTIEGATDDSVTLSGDVPPLKPGDIIISGDGEGLLRKVTAPVRRTRSDTVEVSTEQATLEDVFEQAEFAHAETLDPADIDTVEVFAEGVSVEDPAARRAVTFTKDLVLDDLVLAGTAAEGVVANGRISVSVLVDCRARIERWRLEYFRYAPDATFASDVDVTANAALTGIDASIRLARLTGKPIRLMVGPVPVVMVPRVTIYATCTGDAAPGMRLAAVSDVACTCGVEYRDGRWHAVSSFTQDIALPPDYEPEGLNDVAARTCLADTRASLSLYGVAGPYARMQAPYLAGDWTIGAAPNTHVVDLLAGIDGDAGAEVTILGRHLADVHLDLIDWTMHFPGYPMTLNDAGDLDVVVR